MRTYPNANDPKSVVTLEVDDVFLSTDYTDYTDFFCFIT